MQGCLKCGRFYLHENEGVLLTVRGIGIENYGIGPEEKELFFCNECIQRMASFFNENMKNTFAEMVGVFLENKNIGVNKE